MLTVNLALLLRKVRRLNAQFVYVEMLCSIRESHGGTVAIEEQEIIDASLTLARQGLYVEPTCAHAAAAFSKLIKTNVIDKSEDTVVILTGTGMKTTPFYEETLT